MPLSSYFFSSVCVVGFLFFFIFLLVKNPLLVWGCLCNSFYVNTLNMPQLDIFLLDGYSYLPVHFLYNYVFFRQLLFVLAMVSHVEIEYVTSKLSKISKYGILRIQTLFLILSISATVVHLNSLVELYSTRVICVGTVCAT